MSPDITMCNGGECPQKDECYRHRAVPSMLQSRFVEEPFTEEGCRDFWPTSKGQRLQPSWQNQDAENHSQWDAE